MSNVTLPSNGFYRFINKESGTALELRNGAQVEGTDIYGWEKRSIGVDFFNQVWLIEKEPSNDWYKITNPRSGYSWDLDSGKSDNGTRVQVWGYTGGPNQQWLFRGNDGSGYTISSQKTNTALDLHKGLAVNGTKITPWSDEKSPKQH